MYLVSHAHKVVISFFITRQMESKKALCTFFSAYLSVPVQIQCLKYTYKKSYTQTLKDRLCLPAQWELILTGFDIVLLQMTEKLNCGVVTKATKTIYTVSKFNRYVKGWKEFMNLLPIFEHLGVLVELPLMVLIWAWKLNVSQN